MQLVGGCFYIPFFLEFFVFSFLFPVVLRSMLFSNPELVRLDEEGGDLIFFEACVLAEFFGGNEGVRGLLQFLTYIRQ